MKKAVNVILLSFCMMFFSCSCEDKLGTTITYEVTGTPPDGIAVDFRDELGSLDRFNNIAVPWVKTFKVQHRGPEYNDGQHSDGTFTAYISAVAAAGQTVSLTVSIYVNGVFVSSGTSSEAYRAAQAFYQVRL